MSDEATATVDDIAEQDSASMLRRMIVGIATQSWLASLVLHVAILLVLSLVLGTYHVVSQATSAPAFTSVADDMTPTPPMVFNTIDRTDAILDLKVDLTKPEGGGDGDLLKLAEKMSIPGDAGGFRDGSERDFGSSGTISTSAIGAGPTTFSDRVGLGDPGKGFGNSPGRGGDKRGFGFRSGGPIGDTPPSQRAIAAALLWLSRHQQADGSWSLDHRACCKNGVCSGAGEEKADAAATALAILPFLAAGQTQNEGIYKKQVGAGLTWLMQHQKNDGDLSAGAVQQMYTHGLATIALCEAYGMTQDSRLGRAAQGALDFIQSGQNKDGAWRYKHGTNDSDTSVFGWQVMALKSGQMAGLKVSEESMNRARKFLPLVASGSYREQFAYLPGSGPSLPMTSVGLLTVQYLGAKQDDPAVRGGVEYLSKNMPSPQRRDTYYWYYATQVMHNVPGNSWDNWNRQMRKTLLESQEKEGCAAGSWNPEKPTSDAWGRQGGRLMLTSLSCLTLEVQHRYLPLYKGQK